MIDNYVRFQVLTAASVKTVAFRDTAPCILVEVEVRTALMEELRTSETSIYFNETT
jgi:hypothetical protein